VLRAGKNAEIRSTARWDMLATLEVARWRAPLYQDETSALGQVVASGIAGVHDAAL